MLLTEWLGLSESGRFVTFYVFQLQRSVAKYFATSNYNKVLLTVWLGLSESGRFVTFYVFQLQRSVVK